MKSESTLILASKSPRRATLLRQMGFHFKVRAKDVSENDVITDNVITHVLELSRRKAEAVLDDVNKGIVVGADTVVYLNDQILGKPRDKTEAMCMLRKLSGNTHEVFTGFTLVQVGGGQVSDVEKTAVTFRPLTSWEIEDYVNTGGALDKAGAYGIQDRSGLFVDRIEGCFYNVVGFPLTKFYEGLKKLLDTETLRSMFQS